MITLRGLSTISLEPSHIINILSGTIASSAIPRCVVDVAPLKSQQSINLSQINKQINRQMIRQSMTIPVDA
jgi:hypothetical protein